MRRILNAGLSNYQLPIKSASGAFTVYKSNSNSVGIHAKKAKGFRKASLRSVKGIHGFSRAIITTGRLDSRL